MPNLYYWLGAYKFATRNTDTTDDAFILEVIEAVSRQIDLWTKHRYYVSTEQRFYSARPRAHPNPGTNYPFRYPIPFAAEHLLIDDFLAVSELATDQDGDGTYETVWDQTEYILHPRNAALESPPQPYSEIKIPPFSSRYFPLGEDTIRLTGKAGYYEVLAATGATVGAGGIDDSATSLTVSDGALLDVGQTLLIEAEQLFVTAISGNTATVTRTGIGTQPGLNGTTRAAHAAGRPISVCTYPGVSMACLIQTQRIYNRRNSPFGVSGAETSQIRLLAALDPDVQNLLVDFRQPTVG